MANDIDPSKIVWDNSQPIDAAQVQWDVQQGAPVRGDVPEWGMKNPRLYGVLGAAREVLGPMVEAGGAIGGGIVGGLTGAPAGPVGVAGGAAGGAGLGYGTARELTNWADVALGNKPMPTGTERAEQAGKNVLEGMTYETGGRVVGDVIGRVAKMIPESIKATPEKIATFLRARETGYVVPPSQMQPTWGTRALESVSGKAETGQIASIRNQEVTNKLARQSLGLSPEAPLSKESMQSYRKAQIDMGYEPVRDIGIVNLGKSFNSSLDDIIKSNTGEGSIPAAENKQVTDLVNSFKTKKLSFVNSSDVVDAIRILRQNADEAYGKGENALGRANKAIAQAYENGLDNALTQFKQPELLQNYRAARQNIAKSFDVESAIKEGSGNVDAKKLAGLLQKGKPLSGELETAAQFGNVFKQAARTPEEIGSPGVNNLRPYASTAMATGGATLGSMLAGPAGGVVGGMAGGALGMGAPAAARSVLFSPAMQARLAQSQQPAMTAEMLRRYAPKAITGLPAMENQ